MTVVDLFAGPRGWSVGLAALGLTDIGIEIDPSACATAIAAGHQTIRADVARYPVDHLGPLAGLIGSPPCPTFSSAGKGAGRAVIDHLAAAIVDALAGRPTLARHRKAAARSLQAAYLAQLPIRRLPRAARSAQAWTDAAQAMLTVQPARWIAATQPRWVALEQVPAVLPLWEVYARELRAMGYSTWAGILNAADYGVPQTRRRAILIASLERKVTAPAPTHAQGGAATLFGTLAPWVSMADALGWVGELHHWRGAGMTERHGARPGRTSDEPAFTLEGGAYRRMVVLRAGAQANATVRPADGPAPTITASMDNGDTQWVLRTNQNTDRAAGGRYERDIDRPSPTLTTNGRLWEWTLHTNRAQRPDGTRQVVGCSAPAPALTAKAGGQWAFERPATTIVGDGRACSPPAGTAGEPQSTNAVRLTIAEALILQSFPSGYPVQGTKTKQFEQIGNAVPPLLAAHILAAVTGRALPQEPVVDPRGGGGMRA